LKRAKSVSHEGQRLVELMILTEFSRIRAADIVPPLVDASHRELGIRCVVRTEPAQDLLLQRPGLTLPERLPAPESTKM
jgi:hypothetical protein